MNTELLQRAAVPVKLAVPVKPLGRRLLLWTHMALGLSIGFFFAMMGLSGASMIFRLPLERMVYPALMQAGPKGAGSADVCLAAARHAAPTAKILFLVPPTDAGASMSFVESVKEGGADRRQIAYASASGQEGCAVLGVRKAASDPLGWVMGMHHSLLLGTAGQTILGYLACCVVVLLVSGLVLWWPKRWTRSRLKLRASARPLHYALGFWVVLPLLTAAVTGLYLGWKDPVTHLLVPSPAPPAGVEKAAKDVKATKVAVSLDAVLAAFHEAAPEAHATLVRIGKLEYPITLEFEEAGQDYRQSTGKAVLVADGGTVHVAKLTREGDLTGTEQLLAKAQRVHQAEWGGPVVKLLWCGLGMTPAILFCSGFLLWYRRVL